MTEQIFFSFFHRDLPQRGFVQTIDSFTQRKMTQGLKSLLEFDNVYFSLIIWSLGSGGMCTCNIIYYNTPVYPNLL